MKDHLKKLETVTLWVLLPLVCFGIFNPFPEFLAGSPYLKGVIYFATMAFIAILIGHFVCVGFGLCKLHPIFSHHKDEDTEDKD